MKTKGFTGHKWSAAHRRRYLASMKARRRAPPGASPPTTKVRWSHGKIRGQGAGREQGTGKIASNGAGAQRDAIVYLTHAREAILGRGRPPTTADLYAMLALQVLKGE